MTAEHPALYGNVAAVVDVAESRLPGPIALPSTDSDTEALRDRWLAGLACNKQTAAALSEVTVAKVDVADGGRRLAVRQLRLKSGGLLNVRGRLASADRLASPDKVGRCVGACRSAYLVGYKPSYGGFVTNPVTCRNNACQSCCRRKAWESVQRWLPTLMALYESGAVDLVHVTLTQPTRPGDEPVHLTDFEKSSLNYTGSVAAPGDEAVSTPGESISLSYERLKAAVKAIRRGVAWERSVAGGLYSVESTGRVRKEEETDDGQQVDVDHLRWHTHAHMLLVLPAGTVTKLNQKGGRAFADADDPWWSDLVGRWCNLTGGSPSAQHCELVSFGGRVREALKEVLKYPTKFGALTDAQKADWAATMKGRHLHAQSFGVLRRRSRARNLSDWLAEEDASIEDKLSDLACSSLELPPAVDRAYRRLVASHDYGAALLSVFAAHARYERGCVDEDEDGDDFHQLYVPADRRSHARYIPGVGRALVLTRRRVCVALLNSERLSVIVKPATGSPFPAEVDPSAVLVNLLLAELPTTDVSPELEPDQPRNQDPLTLGNKVTDPGCQVEHRTRAGPANSQPKEVCLLGNRPPDLTRPANRSQSTEPARAAAAT